MAGEKFNDSGLSASSAGYQARQIQDGAMDSSWKHKGQPRHYTEGMAESQAREMLENQKAIEARRKIQAILNEDSLSLDDLSAVAGNNGNFDDPNLFEGISAEERMNLGLPPTGMPKRAQPQTQVRQPVVEEIETNWTVVEGTATLTTGKEVQVWMVENTVTGMNIKKPFRIEEAAYKVAAILNRSGNVNDPRLKKVMEAYDQHMALSKQIRATKKLITEGHKDQKTKLMTLQAKLEGLNMILGI